jgi:hypothetical protein
MKINKDQVAQITATLPNPATNPGNYEGYQPSESIISRVPIVVGSHQVVVVDAWTPEEEEKGENK